MRSALQRAAPTGSVVAAFAYVVMLGSACAPSDASPEVFGAAADDTGFVAPPPGRARVTLPPGPFCVGGPQDILRPETGVPSLMTTNPTLSLTMRKCDNSAFQSSKDCHVQVGTYQAWGAVRESFVWPQGANRVTVDFTVWPDAADFAAAAIGSRKVIYVACDDGANPRYWRQEGPLEVVKR